MPKGDNDIQIVMKISREDLVSVHDAVEYAIADRMYEARYTNDTEDKQAIEACVEQWKKVAGLVAACLGW